MAEDIQDRTPVAEVKTWVAESQADWLWDRYEELQEQLRLANIQANSSEAEANDLRVQLKRVTAERDMLEAEFLAIMLR